MGHPVDFFGGGGLDMGQEMEESSRVRAENNPHRTLQDAWYISGLSRTWAPGPQGGRTDLPAHVPARASSPTSPTSPASLIVLSVARGHVDARLRDTAALLADELECDAVLVGRGDAARAHPRLLAAAVG